jgi:hypothetical protein
MSGLVGIDRAEPPLEKAPVNRSAELRQRVIQVYDLVEARPELHAARYNKTALGLLTQRRSPEAAGEPAKIRSGPDAGYNQR